MVLEGSTVGAQLIALGFIRSPGTDVISPPPLGTQVPPAPACLAWAARPATCCILLLRDVIQRHGQHGTAPATGATAADALPGSLNRSCDTTGYYMHRKLTN